MSDVLYLLKISFLLLVSACNNNSKTWNNKEFANAIDNYCQYIDSIKSEHTNEYLYVEARNCNDSIVFIIALVGGSYDFLYSQDMIVDFFTYHGFDILLLGDFPNEIVRVEKNKNLNIIDDIVKIRYPDDYNKYLKDKNSVAPLIYDYMDMTLVFRNNKLISCKRQYH